MVKNFDFDTEWNYQEPDKTYEKFLKYLPSAGVETDNEYHAQLLTQIARTQSLQRDWNEALDFLKQADKLINETTPVAKIRYHLELGRIYNSSDRKDEAKPEFIAAWEKGKEIGEDNYAIDAAHMMAIVESDPDRQIEWNKKAIAIAEKTKDPAAKKWLGSLYNNTAWSYFEKDEFSDAMGLFQSALDLRVDRGKPLEIVIAKWMIGRTYRAMGEMERALDIQLSIINERVEENLGPEGYAHEELFEIYLAKGDEVKAVEHAKIALVLLEKDIWFMEDEKERHAKLAKYAR